MDGERQPPFLLQSEDLPGGEFVATTYSSLIIDGSEAIQSQGQLPVVYTSSAQEQQVYVAIKSSTSGDTTFAAIPLSAITQQGTLTIDHGHQGPLFTPTDQLASLTTQANDADCIVPQESSQVSTSVPEPNQYRHQVTELEQTVNSVTAESRGLPNGSKEGPQPRSISEGQVSSDFKESLHCAQQVFANIKATLSQSLLDAIPGSKEVFLDHLKSDTDSHLECDPLSGHYFFSSSRTGDFCHIEKSICKLLPNFIPDFVKRTVSQSTQTCDNLLNNKDKSELETEDKSVECDLLKPQFSRSGRQVKAKDYDFYVYPRKRLLVDTDQTSTTEKTTTGTEKRKRGRPRKVVASDKNEGNTTEPADQTQKSPAVPIASWETDLVNSVITQTGASELMIHNAQSNGAAMMSHNDDGHLVLSGDAEGVEDEHLLFSETQQYLDMAGRSVLDSQMGSLQELTVGKENDERNSEEDNEMTADLPADSDSDPTYKSEDEDQVESSKSLTNKSKKPKKDYEALAPFKFFCPQCSFKTKRASHFLKHKKLHEKNMPLLHCKKCSFRSIRLSHLRRHELTHSSEVFKCPKCRYVTDSNKLLIKHIKIKHGMKKTTKTLMKMHQCPRCDYKTTRVNHFLRHIRCHTELNAGTETEGIEKMLTSFKCEQCTYTTQRKEHYIRHMNNVHSDHRPYLCDLCGKAFKRPDALRQHKVTHMDKKSRDYPFKCTLCNKGFRSKAHLTEHKTMHTNIRSYLCEICGSSFKTRSVQRKHVQTIHKNPRAYPCNECEKRFNTKYALGRHLRTHNTPGMRVVHLKTEDPQVEEIGSTEVQVIETHPLVAELSANPEEAAVQIVHDVNENFEQNSDAIRQMETTYIQTTEATTALLYLKDCPQNAGFFI